MNTRVSRSVATDWQEPDGYSRDEIDVRNAAFMATDGFSAKEGRLWNEAWDAARRFYAPNADEANALRGRLGLGEES